MTNGESDPTPPDADESTSPQGDGLSEIALGGFKTDRERAYLAGRKGGTPTKTELPKEEHESNQTAE